MPSYSDRWAQNGALRIHYIDQPASSTVETVSLVVSPGVWEPAERALPLCQGMTRRAVAVSYRGRGRSDTPATGYDLEDHVGDLAAVVKAADLDRFALLGFSRGVGPALAYALDHPHQIAGLVIALVGDLRVVGFHESGHMIPDEEPDKYSHVVEGFLAELDRGMTPSSNASVLGRAPAIHATRG